MRYLITVLKEVTSGAINLLFPPSCIHCGRQGALLCHICVSESTLVLLNVCRKCAEPLPQPGICERCVSEASSLDRLYGSDLYEALGVEQAEMFNIDAMSRSSAELVVPIPLHKPRLRSRGYNQSEILAQVLPERLGLDTRNDVLVRAARTVPQSELPTATARHSAMLDGFVTSPNASTVVTSKRVLLVDDGKYCEGRRRCSQICGSRLGKCGCANGSADWSSKMSGERNG
jgi:predicted amidophosphoribosyltransferase